MRSQSRFVEVGAARRYASGGTDGEGVILENQEGAEMPRHNDSLL